MITFKVSNGCWGNAIVKIHHEVLLSLWARKNAITYKRRNRRMDAKKHHSIWDSQMTQENESMQHLRKHKNPIVCAISSIFYTRCRCRSSSQIPFLFLPTFYSVRCNRIGKRIFRFSQQRGKKPTCDRKRLVLENKKPKLVGPPSPRSISHGISTPDPIVGSWHIGQNLHWVHVLGRSFIIYF